MIVTKFQTRPMVTMIFSHHNIKTRSLISYNDTIEKNCKIFICHNIKNPNYIWLNKKKKKNRMAHIHTRGTSASRDGGNERKASDNGIKPCKNHALHILSFPRLLWSLTLPLSTVLRSCLEEPCGGATTAATSLTH